MTMRMYAALRWPSRRQVVHIVTDDTHAVHYVGCTANLAQRASAHKGKAWWQPTMRVQEVASFVCRLDAFEYERALIRAECPPFNRQSNPVASAAVA